MINNHPENEQAGAKADHPWNAPGTGFPPPFPSLPSVCCRLLSPLWPPWPSPNLTPAQPYGPCGAVGGNPFGCQGDGVRLCFVTHCQCNMHVLQTVHNVTCLCFHYLICQGDGIEKI